MRLHFLFPAFVLAGVASCDTASTAPPPILATAGTFELKVSGAVSASLTGPAVFEDGPFGLRVAMNATTPGHQIEIGPGNLSSGEFAWPVGSHSTNGVPGLLEIELRYSTGGTSYFSTSGTLTIVESTPTHVIAAVDVRAVSTMSPVRIRGSLHALVDPPYRVPPRETDGPHIPMPIPR